MCAPSRAACCTWIGMAAAGDQHLGLERVVAVDLDDLADEVHAVGRDIVEAADERADVRRARLRREQRLRGEKQSVTFTLMPSRVSALHALRPSGVSGTFTTMC